MHCCNLSEGLWGMWLCHGSVGWQMLLEVGPSLFGSEAAEWCASIAVSSSKPCSLLTAVSECLWIRLRVRSVLALVLHEDEFSVFACPRNCAAPRTTYVIVGWLETRLEWCSAKSPNVAVAIWISIHWGTGRVCFCLTVPLCVRRLLLLVKACVWRVSSQDSCSIWMETEIPESTWAQQSFPFMG